MRQIVITDWGQELRERCCTAREAAMCGAGAGAREKGAKVGSTAGKLHAQKENLCPDLLPTCLNSTQMLPMGPKRRPSARTSAASVSGGKRPPRRRREAIVKVSLRNKCSSFSGLAFRVHPKYHGAAVTKIPRKSLEYRAHTPRPKLRGPVLRF
jgi:hypothetical protein